LLLLVKALHFSKYEPSSTLKLSDAAAFQFRCERSIAMLAAEHAAIFEAVLARKGDTAVDLMDTHLRLTTEILVKSLSISS
jgi:DNA-binding GntR family transcriptional regulator